MENLTNNKKVWAEIKGEYRRPSKTCEPFEIKLLSDCDKTFYESRSFVDSGHFSFIVPPGSYRISGASTGNYPGESAQFSHSSQQIILARHQAIARLVVEPTLISPAALRPSQDEGQRASVLQLIPSLAEGPFSRKLVRSDYESPELARLENRHGLYALAEFSKNKTPIVFIHGLLDSPRCFSGILAGLDLERYQPWFYRYPSGMSLREAGDYLASCLVELALQFKFDDVVVCAHSMGGLLARHMLHCVSQTELPLFGISRFISISTPWLGHEAARIGRIFYPPMRASWIDVAQGSDFIRSLLTYKLPSECEHHLFFSHRRRPQRWWKISGVPGIVNHDGFVTLKSQLMPEAQEQASVVMGIDADHRGILFDQTFLSYLAAQLSSDASIVGTVPAKPRLATVEKQIA